MKKMILSLVFLLILSGLVFADDVWNSYSNNVTVMISSGTTGAGNSTALSDSQSVKVMGRINKIAITVNTTFDVGGGSDVVCGIYTSPDNVKWDTVPFDTFDIPITAGSEVQYTTNWEASMMYFKCLIDNSDSSFNIVKTTVTAVGK